MSPSVLTETESRRWHPATEIIVLGCALVLVFGIPSPVVPLLVLAGSTIAAVASPSVKVATWAATVAVLCVPMLIVVGLVQGLFYPGDEVRVLWRAGPVRLSIEGLAIAVQLWLRVTALVALCAVIGLGSDAARFFDGLITLRLPASIAYVCASSLSLIPLVRARVREDLEARAARGWATDRWSVRLRLLPASSPESSPPFSSPSTSDTRSSSNAASPPPTIPCPSRIIPTVGGSASFAEAGPPSRSSSSSSRCSDCCLCPVPQTCSEGCDESARSQRSRRHLPRN